MNTVRRIVIVWLIVTIAISSAMLLGHGEEDRLSAVGLDVCEGMPCFLGITSGVTQWKEVPAHLKGDMVSQDANTIHVIFRDNIYAEIASYANANGVQAEVTYINISDTARFQGAPSNFPPLGYFFLKYGTPCSVRLVNDRRLNPSGDIHISELIYPMLSVTVSTDRLFDVSGSVDFIQLSNNTYPISQYDLDDNVCVSDPLAYGGIEWSGFASPYHYFNLYQKVQSLR
jgi:hypothetical protein